MFVDTSMIQMMVMKIKALILTPILKSYLNLGHVHSAVIAQIIFISSNQIPSSVDSRNTG